VYFDQRCAFHLHAIHEQPQVAAEGEANWKPPENGRFYKKNAQKNEEISEKNEDISWKMWRKSLRE
jgi:hypothetical protein